MQFQIAERLFQRRILLLRFLNAIFAEQALAGRQRLPNLVFRHGLGHRHQMGSGCGRDCRLSCRRDAGQYVRQIFRNAHVVNLARRQACLNPDMPLVLMTDDRKADWAAAARQLPRGSMIIVRARNAKQRLALAQCLGGFAPLLIADDPALAAHIGAAGLHLPEARRAKHCTGARRIRTGSSHPRYIRCAP